MLNGDILKNLRNSVFEISKKYQLSHIGSCISALPIIYDIFKEKKPDEKFVLSAGHAGVALYVVEEYFFKKDAEESFKEHGVHPPYSGSLGMGLTLACGLAQADKSKNVYCLISDGECSEGCVWESLNYIRENLSNLKVHVNVNGFSATQEIDTGNLEYRLRSFLPVIRIHNTYSILPWSSGVDSHYYVMKEGNNA